MALTTSKPSYQAKCGLHALLEYTPYAPFEYDPRSDALPMLLVDLGTWVDMRLLRKVAYRKNICYRRSTTMNKHNNVMKQSHT